MEKTKKNIWLDCDPGIDDSIAILLALFHSEVNLLGISTVAGNVPVEKTSQNALKIVRLAKKNNVKVVQGASSALCRVTEHAGSIHGMNGLADLCFPDHCEKQLEKDIISKEFLYEIYKNIANSTQKVFLVGTGAYTNLALLIKGFPEVREKIEKIVLMGGAIGFGNVTPAAEFNVWSDPEAASIVFNCGIPVVLVPLEVTETSAISVEDINEKFARKTEFFGILKELQMFYAESRGKLNQKKTASQHDSCAVYYVIDPEAFETKRVRVDVEISSKMCDGRTLVDIRGRSNLEKNVEIALKMDVERFHKVLFGTLENADKEISS